MKPLLRDLAAMARRTEALEALGAVTAATRKSLDRQSTVPACEPPEAGRTSCGDLTTAPAA